jgi:hypothetical protein
MDIIFGSISQEKRQADINKKERGAFKLFFPVFGYLFNINSLLALEHGGIEKYVDSDHTDSIDTKV